MKTRHIVSGCLLLLAATSTQAGNFTVGVEAINYAPLYNGSNGSYTGYARDLLDAFGKQYGHTFTYKALPVSRLFDEFVGGHELDFKFPDNPDFQPDTKKGVRISYSAPAVNVVEGMLVLPAKQGRGLAQIKTIATMRGFTAWPVLTQIKNGSIKVTEANSFDSLIQQGTNGDVDAVYTSTIVINYNLNKLGTPGALVLDKSLPQDHAAFELCKRPTAPPSRALNPQT